MQERRTKRSQDPREAAALLVSALASRSAARAVAVVDGDGQLIAGRGAAADLEGLARVGADVAHGHLADIPEDTDAFARPVHFGGDRTLYLVAFGSRMRRFAEAAAGLARIFEVGRAEAEVAHARA
jgi:hypothetical protein